MSGKIAAWIQPGTGAGIGRAISTFGSMGVLVNNAAIFPKKPFLEIATEFWDRLNATKLRGTFLCLLKAIKRMKAQGTGGAIVNISSMSSLQAVVYQNASHNASKAGANIELKGLILGPGRIPLGKMGDPEDLAMAALSFASSASRLITGQLLAVDGGLEIN